MRYTSHTASALALVMALAGVVQAQNPSDPLPVDKAEARLGKFQVLLTERSPLGQSAEIAKRISLKPAASEGDYNLAKEPFEIFVPKSPSDDGTYGLMVVMPMPGHAFPPPKWIDVLEKRHVIWLGDSLAGDGRPVLQRIGLALDAVHNAQKVWKIDPKRIYACPATGATVASGIAIYYPDVFQGQLASAGFAWYAKITDARARMIFNTDKLARPLPEQLALAKNRGRFFFAGRTNEVSGTVDPNELIVKDGYQKAGFKYVKAVWVPQGEMTVWSSYPADWFDQGLEFLDAHAAEANAQTAKAGSVAGASESASKPKATGVEGQPPVSAAAADDPAKKAASALSLARNYVNAGQFEAARKKLQSIVQSYPNTPSALEAQKLLKDIQDK